ncbi:Potassium channel protein [Xanthomarina gelatinilytica]|uniref:Potassium channel protein n=2 Tax=Xanthomarina gelatinilytica TaxID=1137281 RepID=M7MID2_9FLAO|nr:MULTISPECIES: potassium channel protein [Xanthomarina]EMQ94836.1 Potassium channel protein [Xanthomarina gelatinilytica]MAL23727.1 potassium channel protein [Xanthomarina sp.]HAB27669.1 potassium channel protein [Xanthomarina gelatinilytica]HAI19283.1 potassium channel protein [Xanthomarina gelatinilytica]
MNNPLIKLLKSKIYTAIFLLAILLGAGVVGFKILSQLSWIDAFYMTVITITTVGFGEVQPLDESSKVFTILLILTSVVIVGYAISVITEYILSKNNLEGLKQRKMQKKIDNLKDHIIICGYGRNGKQAATKLMAYKKPFVVIEKNKEIAEKYQSELVPFVIGNANEDETLLQAGIERASTLISALPNDADNLFVVLSSRQINSDLNIISRASQETSYKKLKLAGANNVILPDKIGGDHMASLVVVPGLLEFIDNLSIVGKSNINIEEISVEQLYDTSQIKTIRDLDLRKQTGCSVIGFKNAQGEYLINPEADLELIPNSKIIVLGRPEQIQKLNSLYNI